MIDNGLTLEEAELQYEQDIEKKISYMLNGNFISNLSYLFEKWLKEFNISYEMEFKIACKPHNRYYDFKIDNYLIELNGDFWHANPKIYCAEDILPFPEYAKTVQDIWNKDQLKKELAIANGYHFITLWECDLKNPIKIKKIKNIMKLYAERQNKIN